MPKGTDAFSLLTSLVEAPARPMRCNDEGQWGRLVDDIEFEFPDDFLRYGRQFGTGEIHASGYGLLIANPLDAAYPKWIRRTSEWMRNMGDPPDRRATRFYPEEDGVVPFAENWSGDLLFFSPTGANVVTCPTSDPSELKEYPYGFAEFLFKLFSGKLVPEYFPNKEIRKGHPEFKKRAWLK